MKLIIVTQTVSSYLFSPGEECACTLDVGINVTK